MATVPQLSYMLGKRTDNSANTANLYAQLQAPAQRAEQQKWLNEALNRTNDVEVQVGTDAGGNPIFGYVAVPNPETNYSNAVATANAYAKRKTLNPADLVSAYSKPTNRDTTDTYGTITNAYINPDAEGVYDTTPLFDWMGRQTAGVGARTATPSRTDAMMRDLRYGRAAQHKRYDDAVNKAITAGQFQQQAYQDAYEQQRMNANFGYSPDASYERWKSLSPLWQPASVEQQNYEMNRGMYVNYDGSPTPLAQQMAMYQKSQSTLSPSFYRGDNPSSFPSSLSGYGL